MKTFKISLVIVIAALFVMGLGSTVYAFHSGGVGGCEGCHTMHNSLDGTSIKEGGVVGDAGTYLLKGATQSDTCFECHYKTGGTSGTTTTMSVYTPGSGPIGRTPAGDFAWLTKSWGTDASTAQAHGHNINSSEHGISADSRFTTLSPGGSYPYGNGSKFGCQSCHDPHGKARIMTNGTEGTSGEAIYTGGSSGAKPTTINGVGYATGVYRLLVSTGYSPASLSGAFSFGNRAMRGLAAGTGAETDMLGNRGVYGNNASEWCANCHAKMHSANGTGTVHPVGNDMTMSSTIQGNYNSYVKSGVMTGDVSTSYTSLVPFQTDNLGSGNTTGWQDAMVSMLTASTRGMESNPKVICQSCHRTHASGFSSMTRWLAAGEDNMVTTWDTASSAVIYSLGSGGRAVKPTSQLEYAAAMNGRNATVFNAYQRLLCNKCHAKD